MENQRNLRKERIGVVTSSAMDKTVTVNVSRRVKHGMYGKFITFSKKFHAHDETNDCNQGDTVRIMETIVAQGPLRNTLEIPGYRVAAKTGTAEIATSSGYGDDRVISLAGMPQPLLRIGCRLPPLFRWQGELLRQDTGRPSF